MNRRSSAPFWLVTRYGAKCAGCGFGIKKGEDALYFPATKQVLCAGDGCGKKAWRELQEQRFDEQMVNYRP